MPSVTPDPGPRPNETPTSAASRPPRWGRALLALLLIGAAVWAWTLWREGRLPGVPGPAAAASQPPAPGRPGGPPLPTTVLAPVATRGSMPERLGALGTATARATVTVRAQVSGRLEKIQFEEGQTVKAGDLLAQIDPRGFQAELDSALAQLARDEAQLAAAEVDLKRYRTLLGQDSIAAQQVDTQAATVAQLKATVAADRAAVATQRLQLSYTKVVAPVSGRVGFRQVDVGNLVSSSDTNGIVVITQVQPITVVFPVPQQRLGAVQQRVANGATLAVEAWDGDNRRQLATGKLVAIDNQIDVTTGTVKLKAEFANRDLALYPNQFVNVRLTLATYDDVTIIPAAAVQQGSRGPYVFVVLPDDTVVQRLPKLGPGDNFQQAVFDGVVPGERVVVDGIDRLRDGQKVEVLDRRDAPVAQPRQGGRRGNRGGGPGEGASAASAPAVGSAGSASQSGAAGTRPAP